MYTSVPTASNDLGVSKLVSPAIHVHRLIDGSYIQVSENAVILEIMMSVRTSGGKKGEKYHTMIACTRAEHRNDTRDTTIHKESILNI
jgi:hypothetical protein